jgi:hypothetical protein
VSDPGTEIVARVRAALDPEPEWTHEVPGGFAWWPLAAPQRVWAEPARAWAGEPTVRVHCELALAREVPGDGARFAAVSQWNAARHGLSAVRWDGDTGLVSLHASVTTTAGEAATAAQRLAHAAVLQVAEAAAAWDTRLTALGGERPAPAPPGGAPRAEPSPLAEAARAYAEAGAGESPWTRARLEAASRMQPAPWANVRVDAVWLHAEIPAVAPGDAPPGSAPGAGVALLQATGAQPHPVLGPALLVLLRAPVDSEPVRERVVATAALLNEAEAREWTGLDQLGAWCGHPEAGLVYAQCIPARVDHDGLLERLLWQSAARARWSRGLLAAVARMRASG